MTLAQIRAIAGELRSLLDSLHAQHGARMPLYFPFELAETREPRLLQGYAFKLPSGFLALFPALREIDQHNAGSIAFGATGQDRGASDSASPLNDCDEDRGAGRNPPWSRDELILALDLYLRTRPAIPGKGSDEVAELSGVLNRLRRLTAVDTRSDFRNPNGVYMKLMNLRRFDPDYTRDGKVGLTRGNHDQERVRAEFASNPVRLASVAAAIRNAVDLGDPNFQPVAIEDEEEGQTEAPEGRLLTRLHRYRERNRELVRERKASAMRQNGRLQCEACGFDFEARYGERGRGFIECHHTKPLHTLREGDRTRLADLALLCANCHRMVHAARPWLTVEELRALLGRGPRVSSTAPAA